MTSTLAEAELDALADTARAALRPGVRLTKVVDDYTGDTILCADTGTGPTGDNRWANVLECGGSFAVLRFSEDGRGGSRVTRWGTAADAVRDLADWMGRS